MKAYTINQLAELTIARKATRSEWQSLFRALRLAKPHMIIIKSSRYAN